MTVRLDNDFELVFKAIVDAYEWQRNNTLYHNQNFIPVSIVGDLAEILKSEARFRGIPLDIFKGLQFVFDWNKLPFTEVYWGKICDTAMSL